MSQLKTNIKFSSINFKFGMNVHHTPLVYSVSFNSIEPIGDEMYHIS